MLTFHEKHKSACEKVVSIFLKSWKLHQEINIREPELPAWIVKHGWLNDIMIMVPLWEM